MNIISHKSCISNKITPISGYNCNTVRGYRSFLSFSSCLQGKTVRGCRPILPFSPCLQGKTVRKGKRKFFCRHRIAGVYLHREIRTYSRGGTITLTGEQLHELKDTYFIRRRIGE